MSNLTADGLKFASKKLSNREIVKLNSSGGDERAGKTNLIASGGFGKVFVHPKHIQRILKIVEFDPTVDCSDPENEIYFHKMFSERTSKLSASDFRICPDFYCSKIVRVPRSLKSICCIEAERFIGDLEFGVERDALFVKYLSSFHNRLDIYLQLAKGLQQIAKMGFKHSDIKPKNILYKLRRGEWVGDKMLPVSFRNIRYEVVLNDFGLSTKQNVNRAGRNHCFTDPSDYKGKVYYFAKYRELVELFPLGLIIFFVEASVLSQSFEPRKGDLLHDMLKREEGYTESLRVSSNSHYRLASTQLTALFGFISNNVSLMNLRKSCVYCASYSSIQEDLAYLSRFMIQYFRFQAILVNDGLGAEISTLDGLVGFYERFLRVVRKMCRKNRMRGGRPSFSKIISEFQEIDLGLKEFRERHSLRDSLVRRYRV